MRCRLPDGCLLLAACCAVEDLGLSSDATSLPSSQLCQTLHINKAWEPVRALSGRGKDLLAGEEACWQGKRLVGSERDLLAEGRDLLKGEKTGC